MEDEEITSIFLDKSLPLEEKVSIILNRADKGVLKDAINIEQATKEILLLIELERESSFEAGRTGVDDLFTYETYKDYKNSNQNNH